VPLLGWVLVQRIFRPLARRRFKIALPFVVLIRMRKPWVRANDFRDLLLLVRQRADLPAATITRPRPLCLLGPTLDFKSTPSDKPEHWEIKLNMNKNFNYIHADWTNSLNNSSYSFPRSVFSVFHIQFIVFSLTNYLDGIFGSWKSISITEWDIVQAFQHDIGNHANDFHQAN
jgi:hypothetical protein